MSLQLETRTDRPKTSAWRRAKQFVADLAMSAFLTVQAFLLSIGQKVSVKIVRMGEAGTGNALGIVTVMVAVLIGVLVFGSLSPSISTGLNNTESAFAHVTGVAGIIDVVPILLVIGLLFGLAFMGWKKWGA